MTIAPLLAQLIIISSALFGDQMLMKRNALCFGPRQNFQK
jgi:hypothetical protein